MVRKSFYKIVIVTAIISIILPVFLIEASRVHGEAAEFFIDTSYDKLERNKISATLRKVSANAYFYIEDQWWQEAPVDKRNQINQRLEILAQEFDQKIYPELTAFYGSEWKPGIDGDVRITILFHQMREDAAGYFRNTDGYRRIEAPSSNEREMFYVNVEYITQEIVKSYLAHEFVHLITFNQKTRQLGAEEDIWLNELRAEHAPTLMGYDDEFENSNLQTRVQTFIGSPNTSLTEWRFQKRDYGIINIFAQYLVRHYGEELLKDSMAAPYTGIASLNYTLAKMGFDKDFAKIFTEWTIAVYANDCSLGEFYCYTEEPLNYLRVLPSLIYLPATQQSELSLTYAIKEWSGRWYKIIGSDTGIEAEFKGLSDINYTVVYFVEKNNKVDSVHFLELDSERKGIIELPYFGQNAQSLVVVPSILNKTSGFINDEPFWRFTLNISSTEKQQEPSNGNDNDEQPKPIDEMTVEELIAKIQEISLLISQLQEELARMQAQEASCASIDKNLSFGLTDDAQVKCLQEFLKSQGTEIYPEGLVTGNFLTLTRQAVERFQQRYADEILAPLGMNSPTGIVGPNTRRKINEILAR
jgi:peptidoglycan hydrolase-like protein with peptidoglycan-binding domain